MGSNRKGSESFPQSLIWEKLIFESYGNVIAVSHKKSTENQLISYTPVISLIISSISILNMESEVYLRSIFSKEE